MPKNQLFNVVILLLIMLLLPDVNAANQNTLNDYPPYEMPRTHVVPIQDPKTGKNYQLYIKLPKTYREHKQKAYPVVYFTDAVWHIDMLSAASDFLLEKAILVGVSWQQNANEQLLQKYGPQVSRYSDYSYWAVPNPDHPKLQFGLAEQHLAFFKDRVFPFVEQHYRTQPSNRAYFGYSLGGLFGVYALLTQPNIFTHYMLGSPPVDVLTRPKLAMEIGQQTRDAKVLLTNGDLEEGRSEHIQAFMRQLQKNSGNTLNVQHQIVAGNHQTASPAIGLASISWLANMLNEEEK